jgi:hypothetical protein
MEMQGKSESVLSATFSTVRPLASWNSTTREYEALRCFGARRDLHGALFGDCFFIERPLLTRGTVIRYSE